MMELKLTAHPADLAALNLSLNRLAEQTGKTLQEVLPAQMRLLATDLAAVTSPKGKDTGDNQKAMENIMKRIYAIYPSTGAIVNLLKKKNDGLAGKFAGFITTRKNASAQKILDQYLPELNITIGSFDGGALHSAHRNQKKITQRLLVAGYTRVTAYAKKKARMVGYAKGGFATAAKQLGGVRGIPGFATRQKSPGTGTITGDGKTLSVTMTNGVNYLKNALTSADESRAVSHRSKQITTVLQKIQDRKIQRAMRNF